MTQKEILYIMNILRQGTTHWEGRKEALRRARKPVLQRISQKGKPVYKFFWQCADCRQWFREVEAMEVDHIKEIGAFSGCWDDFVRKVYCGQDNLKVLCIPCHSNKTKKYASARSRFKRKEFNDQD